MGTIGARKTAELLDLLNTLLAIDALMVAQSIDIRKDQHPAMTWGPAMGRFLSWVRARAPRLREDRAMAEEIEKLAVDLKKPGTLADTEMASLIAPRQSGRPEL